eukprot:Seg1958.1 transcript_id=Seg1958.1/GoldUCD/mRNA.D3Y31 product="hypothetical protein" protein_id=Seg1958.1/GoldUCD/D3Y31
MWCMFGTSGKNHRHLICESCDTKVHIKCASVTAREFKERDWSDWDCWKCSMPAISDSFYMDENANITSIYSSEEEEGMEGFCLDQLRDEIQTGNKQLITVHINVNGILTRNKLTEIKILLDKTKIDCLGITETKLNKNDSDESLKIEGYKIIRKDRTRNNGGGCLLYYKEHLKVINVE